MSRSGFFVSAALAAGLLKRYGSRTVLDGLDFEVQRGERVAILGVTDRG